MSAVVKSEKPEEIRIRQYLNRVYDNSLRWNFWGNAKPKDQKDYALTCLIGLVGDLSKSIAHDDRPKDIITNKKFYLYYQSKYLGTIDDHLAALAIGLFDYACHFGIRISSVEKYMSEESASLEHIKVVPFTYTFYLAKCITDIKFSSFGYQYIGESLGKVFAIAKAYDINLWEMIEYRLKYLESLLPAKQD